jgi:hypothetical protein
MLVATLGFPVMTMTIASLLASSAPPRPPSPNRRHVQVDEDDVEAAPLHHVDRFVPRPAELTL